MWHKTYKNELGFHQKRPEIFEIFIPQENFYFPRNRSQEVFNIPLDHWNPDRSPFVLLKCHRHHSKAPQGMEHLILKKHNGGYNDYLIALTDPERIRKLYRNHLKYHFDNELVINQLRDYALRIKHMARHDERFDRETIAKAIRHQQFYANKRLDPKNFGAQEGVDPYMEYYSTIVSVVRDTILEFDANIKKKSRGWRGFFPQAHGYRGHLRALKLQKKLERCGNVNRVIDILCEHIRHGGGNYRKHSFKTMLMKNLDAKFNLGFAEDDIYINTKSKCIGFTNLFVGMKVEPMEAQIVPDLLLQPMEKPKKRFFGLF